MVSEAGYIWGRSFGLDEICTPVHALLTTRNTTTTCVPSFFDSTSVASGGIWEGPARNAPASSAFSRRRLKIEGACQPLKSEVLFRFNRVHILLRSCDLQVLFRFILDFVFVFYITCFVIRFLLYFFIVISDIYFVFLLTLSKSTYLSEACWVATSPARAGPRP